MTRPCVAIVVGRAGAGVVVSAGGSLMGVLGLAVTDGQFLVARTN